MNSIDNIRIDLSSEPLIIIAGIFVLVLFSIFVYRYTVPQISKTLKAILTITRISALLILLLLIFEPILIINSKKTIEPVNLLFIDKSKSILAKDSAAKVEQINNLIRDFDDQIGNNNRLFTFGNKIDSLAGDRSNNIVFDSPVTNFKNLFDFINNSDLNIASAVILSDGIITEGLSPVRSAEKMDIPIYTIGVGDTLIGLDVEIKKVQANKYTYAGKPSKLKVYLTNVALGEETVSVDLSDNSGAISRTDLTLNQNGINEFELNYKPTIPGEYKLTVSVTLLENETSIENNKKIIYVDVLKSKLNILLLAGSPSHDLSFIKNSLLRDENLRVKSLVQLQEDSFVEDEVSEAQIDSADILFLIGFPSANTSIRLINKVKEEIINNKKPFFISLAEGLDFRKLAILMEVLPFTLSNYSNLVITGYPNIIDNNHAILKQGENSTYKNWNNLSPILISSSRMSHKPGVNVLAIVKMNNNNFPYPLILANSRGDYRCIAITAQNIWKWKLKGNDNGALFDGFFANTIKWLNTSDSQKQVNITTTKKMYQLGETIEFSAQVYDETFSPFNMADVSVKIIEQEVNSEVQLNPEENGFYSGEIEKNIAGDFEYEGWAYFNEKLMGSDNGKFSVGSIDVEKLTTNLNKDILLLISTLTNGNYCYINNSEQIIENIKRDLSAGVREEYQSEKIELWLSQIFLLLLILLFSAEWFLRKKAGMM